MVIRYASAVVTIAGILGFVSGLVFWVGGAPSLVTMHMLLGFLTVIGLWTVGIAQALSTGGSWILAAVACIVGALTIYIGMNQAAMLPGEHHWLVQLSHLLLGILCIGVSSHGRRAPPPGSSWIVSTNPSFVISNSSVLTE